MGAPAGIIWLTAIAEEIDFLAQRLGRAPAPDELEALTRAALLLGKRTTALDYLRARRALARATRDMVERFRGYDLLMLPATADFPPHIGEIDGRTLGVRHGPVECRVIRFRALHRDIQRHRTAGHIPAARGVEERLPIGVQFAAPLGEDAKLISFAAWLERERPWDERLRELRSRFS